MDLEIPLFLRTDVVEYVFVCFVNNHALFYLNILLIL